MQMMTSGPKPGESTLEEQLDAMTREGEIYERLPEEKVRCYACGHRCRIGPGHRGACRVRFNQGGELRVPWGYVATVLNDPIEKKPFFHVMPGADVLTFGMMGCDLHCSYCQNWRTSQTLRDSAAGVGLKRVSPDHLVALALKKGATVIASSYNEPLITAEWSTAVFRRAQEAGLKCAFISNGNATPEVLDYLRPWVDFYKIDLKTMSHRNYLRLGANLNNILESIEMVFRKGFWLEVVTLLVPGWNTSDEEIRAAAQFLKSVSPDIPWHLWNFHRDYRMREPDNASAKLLVRAASIGREEGLNYVYAGVMPALLDDFENTRCPTCRALLVRRIGYQVTHYYITKDGDCPQCGTRIPGVWPNRPETVRTGIDGLWFERRSRSVAI
jgi:pyruvate formate lyase activating enzyme